MASLTIILRFLFPEFSIRFLRRLSTVCGLINSFSAICAVLASSQLLIELLFPYGLILVRYTIHFFPFFQKCFRFASIETFFLGQFHGYQSWYLPQRCFLEHNRDPSSNALLITTYSSCTLMIIIAIFWYFDFSGVMCSTRLASGRFISKRRTSTGDSEELFVLS